MFDSLNPADASFSQYRTQAEADAVPAPAYKLFDVGSVTLASFLGSPLAGVTLMCVNYRRLGQKDKALGIVWLGILITAVGVLAGFIAPKPFSTAIAVGLIAGMRALAQKVQGEAIESHVDRGGSLASRWPAFGVGMAFLVVLGAAVFAPAMAGMLHPNVMIGANDVVYYTGAATQEDAQALGHAFRRLGLFEDNGANVFLNKGVNGTDVAIVVKEGSWDQQTAVTSLEEMVSQAAPAVGGFPVELMLMDKQKHVKKEVVVGQKVFEGRDQVYYLGSATAQDAKEVGDGLQKEKFFSGSGSDVFVNKDSTGTALTFVVEDGVWDNAGNVAGFKQLVRRIAPSIGGLPVELRLADTTLKDRKQVTVE